MQNQTPFINRDYNTSDYNKGFIRRRQRKPSHIHWVVFALSILFATFVFSFPSKDAQANRSISIQDLTDPLAIALPLALPDLANLGLSSDSEDVLADEYITEEEFNGPSKGSYVDDSANLEEALKPKNLWRTVVVKSGDTLADLFAKQGFSATTLHEIVSIGQPTNCLTKIQPGQLLQFHHSEDGQLTGLMYHQDALTKLEVRLNNDRYQAKQIELKPEIRVEHATGVIRDSLFQSAQRAGLSDRSILDLANIFAYDIDFALDIQEGDQFTLIYEAEYLNGKKLQEGKILAASFSNQGKTYYAIEFETDAGRSDYYTPDGKGLKKAFIRTPVEFSRISSGFSLGRKHPILNRIRSHKGVDYAAPMGTPVKAAGNGQITLKGVKGGYGNAIVIQHGERYSTLYGHLTRFKKGLKVGSRVHQGEVIGFVGMTGLATGPHLHYEFRIDGTHRDPLTVKLPNSLPLDRKYRSAYTKLAGNLKKQLDSVSNSAVAMRNQASQ